VIGSVGKTGVNHTFTDSVTKMVFDSTLADFSCPQDSPVAECHCRPGLAEVVLDPTMGVNPLALRMSHA
jgi:hypothetical protein